MNGRTIAIAVAALATAGLPPRHAAAPPPSHEAAERLAASRPALPPPPARARPALDVAATERLCLALNVYWESRGQIAIGQAAVAHVTLNRVGRAGFAATICGVVRQAGADGTCQFGWWCSGRPRVPAEGAAWREAQAVAARALAGEPDPTEGALYFHRIDERPRFAAGRYAGRVRIGDHVFFRLTEPAAAVLSN